jgi:hypothetical protein
MIYGCYTFQYSNNLPAAARSRHSQGFGKELHGKEVHLHQQNAEYTLAVGCRDTKTYVTLYST